MKNYAPINENKDVVTKEYVDNASVASAEKLTTDAGSSAVPVYFKDGKPKVCAYTLGSMSKESASDYEKAAVIDEKFAAVKNDIAINRTTLGTQCKNLCNVTYTTRKAHTVNITVNSDKSLGLLTDSTTSIVCVEILTPLIRLYANVTYILTGTNNGNIRIELRDSSKSNILVYDSGSGVEYTPNKDIDVYVCLRIEKSTSITSAITVYPMLRIKGTDDTFEPYQPSLIDRCLLKDTAGINLGHAQSDSITIDNLASYTALWINVAGAVAGINFITNLIVPVAYLAKSTSNRVQLAGGIPSSAYTTSAGVLAAKNMSGYITAKVSGNKLDLTISDGTIGSVEVISLI